MIEMNLEEIIVEGIEKLIEMKTTIGWEDSEVEELKKELIEALKQFRR